MERHITYRSDLKEKARTLRKNQTFPEKLIWEYLRHNQLGYKFLRQVPIDNYIVDFMSKELNLIIEIDGESHDYQIEYDGKRERRLRMFNFNILRFDNEEVISNIINVIDEIKTYINEFNN